MKDSTEYEGVTYTVGEKVIIKEDATLQREDKAGDVVIIKEFWNDRGLTTTNNTQYFLGEVEPAPSTFPKPGKTLKESLEDWMVVENTEGNSYLVYKTEGRLLRSGGYSELRNYTADLENEYCEGMSIVKVYRSVVLADSLYLGATRSELLWERQEKSTQQLEIEAIEAEQRTLADKTSALADRLSKLKEV